MWRPRPTTRYVRNVDSTIGAREPKRKKGRQSEIRARRAAGARIIGFDLAIVGLNQPPGCNHRAARLAAGKFAAVRPRAAIRLPVRAAPDKLRHKPLLAPRRRRPMPALGRELPRSTAAACAATSLAFRRQGAIRGSPKCSSRENAEIGQICSSCAACSNTTAPDSTSPRPGFAAKPSRSANAACCGSASTATTRVVPLRAAVTARLSRTAAASTPSGKPKRKEHRLSCRSPENGMELRAARRSRYQRDWSDDLADGER